MPRIKADLLTFDEPARSLKESPHGSQREDSLLALYLKKFGWGRECSPEVKRLLLPGVPPVAEGNGRGRGTTFLDAYRRNVSRSCGGDFLSLKAPKIREGSEDCSTAPDLFKGTRDTLSHLLLALRKHHKNGKKIPVVCCHTRGDTFSPVVEEWAMQDGPSLVANAIEFPEWGEGSLWGVPIKPKGVSYGRRGNPVPIWIRHQQDSDNPEKVWWILSASFAQTRVQWHQGSIELLARHIDEACR
jgi:hypothetical protein